MKKYSVSNVATSTVLAIGLAGCLVGPDYDRPTPTVPESWTEASGDEVSSKSVVLEQWWTAFGDPTLDLLIERAVSANLDLELAASRLREARAETGRARGALLPEVDAAGTVTRNRYSENGAFPLATPEQNLYSAGFDAQWELDLFGGARREVDAADAEADAALEDRRAVLVSLLAEVASSYVDVRGNQRLAPVARRNTEAARATLDLTETRERAGLATALDVTRARALLSSSESALPQYETATRVAIHRLGTLLALSPGDIAAELEDERPVPAPPAKIFVGVPSDALNRRPDVRRAERRLAAATARVGAAVADRYPRFSLTGAFGLESTSSDSFADAASRAWSIGPAMRWPLFAGGRIAANIEVQDARAEQALLHYQQSILAALEEVENALVSYLREWDHRRLLHDAAEANRSAVKLADELYRKGLTSFLDVLDAERELYDAELALAASEVASSRNVVALYKALGGGWESEG